MTENLPAPMTPAGCDLRGYEFMPFFGNHLFGSDFNSRASDAEWRAAITLWWAAWNQVPAASLPDDDAALCRLADMGREIKAFRKVKSVALHGFSKCSDGRLYHKFLAPKACEAWDRRLREKERKAKWRQSRGQDRDVPGTGTETGTEPGRHTGQRRDVPAERRGEESELKERKKDAATPPIEISPKDRLWRDGIAAIGALAQQPPAKFRSVVGGWLKTSTAEQVLEAIAKAQAEKAIDPVPFITACLNRGRKQAPVGGLIPLDF
jgi:hypothetical protein